MNIEGQAIEIAKREVLKKLATEEPYLFGEGGIYHIVKAMGTGKKTFTIHVDNGFVKQLVIHTNLTQNYQKSSR